MITKYCVHCGCELNKRNKSSVRIVRNLDIDSIHEDDRAYNCFDVCYYCAIDVEKFIRKDEFYGLVDSGID